MLNLTSGHIALMNCGDENGVPIIILNSGNYRCDIDFEFSLILGPNTSATFDLLNHHPVSYNNPSSYPQTFICLQFIGTEGIRVSPLYHSFR